MSNQPKIVYRSDSTGCSYQMMLFSNYFIIHCVDMDGVTVSDSDPTPCQYPWRLSVNLFFDMCTLHINKNVWTERRVA